MSAPHLTFAGAAGCVTGSCYHLERDGFGLVVDCGVFQGRDGEGRSRAPFAFDAAAVDAVVLTHGHLDHVGRLPRLAQQGFDGSVVAHAATRDVARLILEDGARVATYRGGQPLYDAFDVRKVLSRVETVAYGAEVERGPFRIRLFDAGHILGSASVRVAWDTAEGERAVLFSGDLGASGAALLREPNATWDPERDAVDWVVTESTYGDSAHPGREDVREAFRRAVARAVADGGKVLIPAFAVGRTQEVLYDLEVMAARGTLRGVPVIVDGPLGIAVTELFDRHRECWDEEALTMLRRGDVPLQFRDLYAARTARESARTEDIEGPAILVAGSGMCTGGRILDHLARHLGDARTDVVLVGYQAEGTLGRSLQEGASEADIDGMAVPVRATVTSLRGYSAHADREGLARWFGAVPRRGSAHAFVTHGEPDASASHARHLRDRFGVETSIPAHGDTVTLA